MNEEEHDNTSGWQQWSNYVLKALEKADERMGNIECRLRKVESEQNVIKTKLALYVAVATAIASGIIVIVVEASRLLIK